MKHKIEIAPNLAIYIDGERVIGSKPYGMFLTTIMIVSDDDLKRLADRCLEVISDCKTEPNNSEKLNNCECDTCKYGEDKHRYAHICNECGVGINNYEPKDESTISKMEQVDKLQTKDYCDICNHKGCEYCISDSRNPYCIPSNYEPRTERNE